MIKSEYMKKNNNLLKLHTILFVFGYEVPCLKYEKRSFVDVSFTGTTRHIRRLKTSFQVKIKKNNNC